MARWKVLLAVFGVVVVGAGALTAVRVVHWTRDVNRLAAHEEALGQRYSAVFDRGRDDVIAAEPAFGESDCWPKVDRCFPVDQRNDRAVQAIERFQRSLELVEAPAIARSANRHLVHALDVTAKALRLRDRSADSGDLDGLKRSGARLLTTRLDYVLATFYASLTSD